MWEFLAGFFAGALIAYLLEAGKIDKMLKWIKARRAKDFDIQ